MFSAKSQPKTWTAAFEEYPQALKIVANKKKSSNSKLLLQLDSWLRTEFPQTLKTRSPKLLDKSELMKIVEWKLLV